MSQLKRLYDTANIIKPTPDNRNQITKGNVFILALSRQKEKEILQ